jgi:hypothetical protein
MADLSPEKLERLRARTEAIEEQIVTSIAGRWGDTDWSSRFPWWREPTEVRILMYADDFMEFSDLRHIRKLLESQPYPHVRFTVTTAHRDKQAAPIANIDLGPVKLPDLKIMDDFDVIWFFGSRPVLPTAERDAINDLMKQFMGPEKFGGVLVTGDHSALGRGLAGTIPRVGAMRLWTIPGIGKDRHSTLVEGPDDGDGFNAEDEADDRPQTINHTRFPLGASTGVALQPHPVLSGPNGPIDVLPDHEHEGEAVVPTEEEAKDTTIWPKIGEHQELPVVIALGQTKDPNVNFKQFGVVSVYNGHAVEVGRIIADSSWHHWLDSNLSGLEKTPDGQAALKKVDAYFLNCGSWLAPPAKQREIRDTAWWSIVRSKEAAEIPPDAPLAHFGELAVKELKRFASSSAVSEWILGPAVFNDALSNGETAQLSANSSLLNVSVQQLIAGGILKALMHQVGPFNPEIEFLEPPSDEQIEQAITDGTADALTAIQTQLDNEASRLLTAIATLK